MDGMECVADFVCFVVSKVSTTSSKVRGCSEINSASGPGRFFPMQVLQ